MKRYQILIPILFLTLSLSPLARAAAQSPLGPVHATAYEVIDEVNALRASHGLAPYTVSPILMAIAQSHAEYQASTGIVTHYSADGSRPYQRALAAGYSLAGDVSQGGFFSENIDSGKNLSAADVVERWQADTLHLNTMISPDLQDIGVGVAVADGVTFYTLDAGLATGASVPVASSESGGGNPFATSTGTPSTLQPLAINTALEDGTVYHIVQANEALWSIALAYDTTIDELKRLNRLVNDDIYEGQKLVISKKEVETPTPPPSITVTLGIPTSTPTLPVTPSITFTATPLPTPPASTQNGRMIVGAILLVALLGAGLGTWLGRRKPARDDD